MKVTAELCTGLLLTALSTHAADAPVVVSTEVIGPFTGHDAALHPDNAKPVPILYYGTDLGFTYEHQGNIVFLFGDTWATEAYAPIEASTGARFDDGIGSIRMADWTEPSAISPDNIPAIKLMQKPGSNEMSAMDPGHAMDLGKTPMHGFSNGRDEFAIFNITKSQGCAADADCGDGLGCDTGLGYIGTHYFEEAGFTAACVDGSPFCTADTMAGDNGSAIAGSGFCVDRTSSVWSDTPTGRIASVALNQRIGMRSQDDPRKYGHTRVWRTNKFANVTARTVQVFEPKQQPDYRGADGSGARERVFLWGRPGFVGVRASNRTLALYFAYVDLPASADYEWQVNYYTGSDADGIPRFSAHAADAVPLDLDADRDGTQPDEVHDITHQMSVSWVVTLGRWVMFYGGGISDLPMPTLPDCGVLQLFAYTDCKQVDIENGAIRMRTAVNPWGPWSTPQDVLVGGDPHTGTDGQYVPGGVLHHPACSGPACATHTQSAYYRSNEYGFLYSANIIEQWTRPMGDGVDILWNASTWDPYRVILLRTRINP
jgi:hypothetical protein